MLMKWSEMFTSSVGKKLVMALSGLFLITFLIIHVGINSCVFNDLSIFDPADDGRMFNKAAHFMGASVVIRIIEIGLFIGFIIHIIQGFVLEYQNRTARQIGYRVKMGTDGTTWYAKSMGLLGTLLLLFLIMHISHFLGAFQGHARSPPLLLTVIPTRITFLTAWSTFFKIPGSFYFMC